MTGRGLVRLPRPDFKVRLPRPGAKTYTNWVGGSILLHRLFLHLHLPHLEGRHCTRWWAALLEPHRREGLVKWVDEVTWKRPEGQAQTHEGQESSTSSLTHPPTLPHSHKSQVSSTIAGTHAHHVKQLCEPMQAHAFFIHIKKSIKQASAHSIGGQGPPGGKNAQSEKPSTASRVSCSCCCCCC